ncbi:MAG: HDIG domain-containing protein [Thermoleophilia bacterium]|nr:HDIG domain-containing protein [Thermoleophilia bacterium]
MVELTPGQAFSGRYVCARKDRLTARNGSGYLSLELRDKSGSIPARIFRDVDQIGLRFERGDVIRVKGKAERFRGVLSAELEDAVKDETATDPTEFLPTAYRDREELEGFLEHLTREVHNAGLRNVVETLLFKGPQAEEFRRAPCTRAGHHAYVGGLIEHTVAVATLVTETCVLHPRLNSDLLMAAALIHDIGKTEEFTYGAEIGLSERGKALGHLHLGAEMITEASTALERGERDALMSTVMCHHGTDALRLRHFPSPEAIALYRLNALDAGVKTALEHGIK